MFENLIRALYKPSPKKVEPITALPVKDAAWIGNSNIFTTRDFAQYNPDDLIGRKGYGIYKRMMQDEQVKAVVKFRRDAITSRDWAFELDDESLSDEERESRIELMASVIEQMERPKFTDSLNGIMSATYNGFSMTEKTFKQIEFKGKSWWGIKRLRLKPFDTFYFTVDDTGELKKVHQEVQGKKQPIKIENFIHFVQNPEVDEHYGSSELREAYRPYFGKEHVWKYRMIWVERHAGGFKYIIPKEGHTLTAGSPEFTALQNFLDNSTVGASGILPSGIDIRFEWPQNNVAFGEVIKDCDLAIAKALLVPNLLGVTPEVSVGSQARAETQLNAFLWTLDADAGRLEELLNDTVFEPISEINFGGDPTTWPRFKFKPFNDEQILKVVEQWSAAVSHGAVTPSESDEQYIRDLLEFPAKSEPLVDPNAPDPNAPADPNAPDDPDDPENKKPEEDDEPKKKEEPVTIPETVIGSGGKLNIEHKRAFAAVVEHNVIGKRTENLVDKGTEKASAVLGEIIRNLESQLQATFGADAVTTETDALLTKVKAFTIPGPLKNKLKRTLSASMKSGWDLGIRHAQNEVQRVKDSNFSVDAQRSNFIAKEFFDIRSFIHTGTVTDDILTTLSSAILQGAKAGQTYTEIFRILVRSLAIQGMVPNDLFPAPGDDPDETGVETPNFRVRTLIRTTVFEATNEARLTAFTDPELEDFVQAFEYSAILDLRTTDICKALDDNVYAADSPIWSGAGSSMSYNPPNHYNCRSILIPITELDEWTESSPPTVKPQERFR